MQILLRCVSETIRVLCVREFQNSISDSVYRLLLDKIYDMKLENHFSWTQNEIRSHTGSTINFRGLRDPSGIRSVEQVDLVFCEESQTMSNSSWAVLVPSVRAPKSEIWAVFNPLGEDDPTYEKFVTNPAPSAIVREINYDQNPFFPDVLRAEMEHMRETDPALYRHVWQGECRSMSDASVFYDRWQVKEFNDDGVNQFFFGLDFGYSNDPMAFVRCFVRKNDDGKECLWIDFEAGGTKIEMDKMPEVMTRIKRSRDFTIYADCAQPQMISFVKRIGGFLMQPSEKWNGSVQDGLAHMRSYTKIYIHPRCKETIKNFKRYRYKIDRRTDKVLADLKDGDEDYIDAIRYSLTRVIPRRGFVDVAERIGQSVQYGFIPNI